MVRLSASALPKNRSTVRNVDVGRRTWGGGGAWFSNILSFALGVICCHFFAKKSNVVDTASSPVVYVDTPPSSVVFTGAPKQGLPNSAPIALDIDNICPRASAINSIIENSPPPNLMPLDQLQSIVKHWHEINCPQKDTCQFSSIGQHLLHVAMKRNRTLLSVQVGAMDGRSNDPMYEMFVETRGKNYVQARWGDVVPGRDSSFLDLRNWLPVMIEPVPKNYEDVKQTYLKIANDTGLGCAVPIHAAVSYDSTKTSCPFCRINTADTAPARCKELPDWMKLQIGTLDCEHSKRFFKKDFDLCVLQDPLPCSSLLKLLSDNFVPTEHIAMLQIDIEGYEYILLDGLFKELSDKSLPPVIHFEHKVMIDQDKMHPLVNTTSRLDQVKELMGSRGYHFYDEGEDYLALKL